MNEPIQTRNVFLDGGISSLESSTLVRVCTNCTPQMGLHQLVRDRVRQRTEGKNEGRKANSKISLLFCVSENPLTGYLHPNNDGRR